MLLVMAVIEGLEAAYMTVPLAVLVGAIAVARASALFLAMAVPDRLKQTLSMGTACRLIATI